MRERERERERERQFGWWVAERWSIFQTFTGSQILQPWLDSISHGVTAILRLQRLFRVLLWRRWPHVPWPVKNQLLKWQTDVHIFTVLSRGHTTFHTIEAKPARDLWGTTVSQRRSKRRPFITLEVADKSQVTERGSARKYMGIRTVTGPDFQTLSRINPKQTQVICLLPVFACQTSPCLLLQPPNADIQQVWDKIPLRWKWPDHVSSVEVGQMEASDWPRQPA